MFVNGCLLHIEKWFDGNIYVNVRRFRPGTSLSSIPEFDKTVYITDNAKGREIVKNYKSSLVEYVSQLDTKDKKIVLTF